MNEWVVVYKGERRELEVEIIFGFILMVGVAGKYGKDRKHVRE